MRERSGEPADLRRIVILDSESSRTRVAVPPRSDLVRPTRRGIAKRGVDWRRRVRLQRMPCPSAVELDGFRAVGAQDVRSGLTLVTFLREHHDHASARPHVFYQMLQVSALVAERSSQRPLKLRQEPMLGARGIRTVEVLFAMEDVDVLPREPELQQGLDGSPSMLRVDDGAHHAIRRIRDKVVPFGHVASHRSAIGGRSYTMSQRGARQKRGGSSGRLQPIDDHTPSITSLPSCR